MQVFAEHNEEQNPKQPTEITQNLFRGVIGNPALASRTAPFLPKRFES